MPGPLKQKISKIPIKEDVSLELMNSSTKLIRMPLFNSKEKAPVCNCDSCAHFLLRYNSNRKPHFYLCYKLLQWTLCKGHTWYMFHLLWLNKSAHIFRTGLFILVVYLLSRTFRFSQQTIQCYLKSYLWYLLLNVLNYISSKE